MKKENGIYEIVMSVIGAKSTFTRKIKSIQILQFTSLTLSNALTLT
jgi:hypothetical protein